MAKDLVTKFESIGDNCEFGFVQRRFGVEPGGLLRWAIASPTALVNALKGRFSNLYVWENLEPSSDDMLLDKQYGIYFHTAMRSSLVDGVRKFLLPEEDRKSIHADEIKKMLYLKDKLIQQLTTASLIFVYKRNVGVSDDLKLQLHDALLAYNRENVLLIVEEGGAPGSLSAIRDGLMVGQIDRLALYERADDFSERYWIELCEKTVKSDHSPAAIIARNMDT